MRKGHYGGMDFLDDQTKFVTCFGDFPAIIPEKPTDSNVLTTRKLLTEYADNYKLDIFMYLCRLDYVGHAVVDIGLNVQEVCRQISDIK